MPAMINITDKDVARSAEILIPGHEFDDERTKFIKNLESRDLMAVPGSGKTTALQAKLYCLSQHLPFRDGSGILVLSHTNAAVNEFNNNLGKSAAGLFSYPNFVGTIQTFVDKFLSIPYYESLFHKSINRIDRQEYDDDLYYSLIQQKGVVGQIFFGRQQAIDEYNDARLSIDKDGTIRLLKGWAEEKFSFNSKFLTNIEKREEVYRYILDFKINELSKGVLNYNDSYALAYSYINNCPSIIQILQKRFRYVFVDEAQDSYEFQLNLLNKIFDKDKVCIQYIGDINQAIYDTTIDSSDCLWKPYKPLMIKKSIRLNPTIAKIVDAFTLDRQRDENGTAKFVVEGAGTPADISPYIVLFDDQSKDKLESVFRELITTYRLPDTKEGKKYGFHIIAWNCKSADLKENDKDIKYRLANSFMELNGSTDNIKHRRQTFSDFMQLSTNTFLEYKQGIVNAILYNLRRQKITDKDDHYYSPTSFIKRLKEEEGAWYENYQLYLYEITKSFIDNNKELATQKIRELFLKVLNPVFALNDRQNNIFIGSVITPVIKRETVVPQGSVVIEKGSVHSVKGQTHCATMYVETYYDRLYESTRIKKMGKRDKNPLLLQNAEDYPGKLYRQMLRLMYVGFSRPTHLLCFAVLKSHLEDNELTALISQGWKIKDITSTEEPLHN